MRGRTAPQDMSVNYWTVYTDVVMSMLLILILFVFAQFLANSKILARLLIEQRQTTLGHELMDDLGPRSKDVSIVVDGNLQRIRFSDAILFDRGDDQLKDTGKDILRVVGKRLNVHNGWISIIQIEGHTDRRPIRRGFASNWELSSARATSVVRFLSEQVNLDPKTHPLAATGRAEFVPLSEPPEGASVSEQEDHFRKNRRVEVVLTYSEREVTSEWASFHDKAINSASDDANAKGPAEVLFTPQDAGTVLTAQDSPDAGASLRVPAVSSRGTTQKASPREPVQQPTSNPATAAEQPPSATPSKAEGESMQ